MATKNPWIGLASYDENSINSGYKFCGRQAAILEVFSKVENNVFTTLYGKSGIGKTSLIKAGLFPKLKANGYFPVHIRLGLVSDGMYAEFITDTLAANAARKLKTQTHQKRHTSGIISEQMNFMIKTGRLCSPL